MLRHIQMSNYNIFKLDFTSFFPQRQEYKNE